LVSRLVVFLDDGGVMNDNRRRSQQWQYLVGEFFTPLLGGTPEAWAEANRIVVAAELFDPAAWRARLRAEPDYASFERAYLLDWLSQMCALVGVPGPPAEESVDLARRAGAWIIRHVDAAFPGVVHAVRLLHARGYALHTASGESSADLEGYLNGMGLRDCFVRLYGPDLIDTFKEGPEYYERLLSDAGVAPAHALVVDDSPHALDWAAQAGAQTVLVGTSPSPPTRVMRRIGSLAELPDLVERLGSGDQDGIR
jgi:HAD superfamily hydrolase (TIGR01509 family)